MDDRIEKLEIHAAEQERLIEELSEEVTRQAKEIEALRSTLELLTRRLAQVEEQSGPETPVTRPPHY